MKIEVDTVKGFQDYLPTEALKRKALVAIAEKYFKLYGFLPIETPIVEFDELMKSPTLPSEGEDEAVSDRFKLQDRGKRNLGLRYEFTFQLARLLKMNPNIKMPFKRYQIGPVFRDEPTRTGRTRQFTQCDIDVVGDTSINAEAECLACISDILKELKLKPEIQVNNRKLLNALIQSVQIKNTKQVMRELDKVEKIGIDEVKSNLRKITSPNQILTLLKLLEKDLSFFKSNAFSGVEELEELISISKKYGIKLTYNPFLVRGLGYYTGNIFEFVKDKRALIAGGRYDKTVGRFLPNDIPAVGISFSLEALFGLCPNEISQLKNEQYPKVLILSINQDEEAISLTRLLRKKSVSCTMQSGKPSRALDFADSQNIPYVIFIGQEEITEKKFKLKNMKTGNESMLSEKQIVNKLS